MGAVQVGGGCRHRGRSRCRLSGLVAGTGSHLHREGMQCGRKRQGPLVPPGCPTGRSASLRTSGHEQCGQLRAVDAGTSKPESDDTNDDAQPRDLLDFRVIHGASYQSSGLRCFKLTVAQVG